ncbi:MAG: substrate-binding domain-containing protein [Cytophagales bacterium]|nr:substrate-binding domain-containing protein [Cytophagales bacterium]
MKPKNIRIKDIAQLAGVSQGTVDRVLHKRGNVSKLATEKVNRVLAKSNYKPNLIARTLGNSKIYTLAVLLPDPQMDPFWKQSYDGMLSAQHQLTQLSLKIELENHFFDLNSKESFQKAALEIIRTKPDGVLVAPLFFNTAISFLKDLQQAAVPFVFVNTNIAESQSIAFIGQDLYKSGRLGAQLLFQKIQMANCYVILHIDESLQNAFHLKEKERGFTDYLTETGLSNQSISITIDHQPGKNFEKAVAEIIGSNQPAGVLISTSKAYQVAPIIKSINPAIQVVGYDLIEANLNLLQTGKIDFIINQNPFRQSRLGIQILANHLFFKRSFQSQYLFPLEVITSENAASYLLHTGYSADLPE